MTATDRDPAAMTAAERQAEIAELLARGYLRLRTARLLAEKGLDVLGGSEAQSCPMALRPRSTESAR